MRRRRIQSALALIRHMRAMRRSSTDRQAVLDAIAREPRVINARGPEGATPLMYAALYADAEMLRAMLAGRRQSQHDQRLGRDRADVGHGRSRQGDAAAGCRGRRERHLGIRPHRLVIGNYRMPMAAPRPNCCWRAARNLRRRRWRCASKRESESIVRKLLAAGAKDKGDAAGVALRAGCITCLDALLP